MTNSREYAAQAVCKMDGSSQTQENILTNEFSQLGLRPELLQTLTTLEHTTPTPIQTAIIPTMMDGQDVIGQAQTGTGKTAAFALPILNNMEPNLGFVQALVLAPTRELAMQVATAIHEYGKGTGISVLPVYGGAPYSTQIRRLKRGVDIVVGTPGRLLDLIRKRALNLSMVSTVVLDEADEMLSMGFVEDIESILEQTSADRQTTLFSATMPPAIRKLADTYLNNPQSFTIARKHMTVDAIEQKYCLVNFTDKLAALTRLLEAEPVTSALIFARTRAGTGELADALTARGIATEALNGDMNQDARTRTLNRFRDGRVTVLVATDVAARGLDIDNISHVFNYDLPDDLEVFVHRVGRTGRAGKTGVAISLITPKEQWRLNRIEKFTKQKIAKMDIPTTEDILARRKRDLIEKVMVWLRRERYSSEMEIVTELVEAGFDPLAVAAASLKLARKAEKQRPIEKVSEVQFSKSSRERGFRKGRNSSRGSARGSNEKRNFGRESHEDGMVRITLGTGEIHGVRINHIVRSLAQYAGIPGHTIGKIRIQKERTFVDVPEQFVGKVLNNSQDYRIGSKAVSVERA